MHEREENIQTRYFSVFIVSVRWFWCSSKWTENYLNICIIHFSEMHYKKNFNYFLHVVKLGLVHIYIYYVNCNVFGGIHVDSIPIHTIYMKNYWKRETKYSSYNVLNNRLTWGTVALMVFFFLCFFVSMWLYMVTKITRVMVLINSSYKSITLWHTKINVWFKSWLVYSIQ